MTNDEIGLALREIALFLDMRGVDFKPRAYEKAAHTLEALEKPLDAAYRAHGIKALNEIPGVGKSIAGKVAELLDIGHIEELERMREETPVEIVALTAVEGVGPRKVKTLYDALGIRTLSDLRAAAEAGRIGGMPGFGKNSGEKILKAIAFLEASGGRQPISHVLRYVRPIEARLREQPFADQVVIAGSVRRFRETIGDVDFLVISSAPEQVMDYFTTMPEVTGVHARGPTKASVRLKNGIDADLRVVPAECFGAALCYFTGSKYHNVVMRQMAIARGYKLNEYGLFHKDDESKCVAGRTEEEIFEALGLPWIPPELRENNGEFEAAREGCLPELAGPGDLRGDLQIQTTWTDGAASIEEMALAARALGREYIAITDHTRDLSMVRGSDEAKLREQTAAIKKLNIDGIRVLCGAEVNIRRDGSLDVDDEVLAELDVVGAAIHHHFTLSRDEMTARVIRAMENPHVDIFFHPTARKFGQRPPVDLDMDAIIAAAVRTGTILEIDAQPDRLDLKDEHVRKAVEGGAYFTIDSDAHSVPDLAFPDTLGIPLSRRGWAPKDRVINTLPAEEFLARLKGR